MDPFSKFLRSGELGIWNDSLSDLRATLPATFKSEEDVTRLVNTFIVACFVQWMSRITGDKANADSTDEVLEELIGTLKSIHHEHPTDASRYGIGILAGWNSYHSDARRIIGQLGMEREENVLLLVPINIAQKAIMLGKYLANPEQRVFPPIFYFYCDALLAQGSMAEVLGMIDSYRMDTSNGMIIDLLGRIKEQTGDWSAAHDLYIHSDWPLHLYRASICHKIVKGFDPEDLNKDDSEITRIGLRNSLEFFEGEISQSEVARTSAFINTCKWYGHDNWMINLELGKLNFRLKRHAEAEQFLKKSFDQAPSFCKAPIGNLRFINLTWIGSGTSVYKGLNADPETLECGRHVIDVAVEEKQEEIVDHITTWIAYYTFDEPLFEPALKSKDYLVRSQAYSLLSDRPSEIRCWREGISRTYSCRLHIKLIRLFDTCQFHRAMFFLIDNVLDNSRDNFRELIELATDLLVIKKNQSVVSSAYDQLNKRSEVLDTLLFELGQKKYQDAIRAYEYFSVSNRQDICESLLSRAGILAENPEEFLELAIARRKVKWFSSREGDTLGLNALVKAERESRDRLQRLEIAREYCYYGQLQRAYQLLIQEEVFDSNSHMLPVEYVVALECLTLLKSEKLPSVLQAATENLIQLNSCGQITYFLESFLKRLANVAMVEENEIQQIYNRLREKRQLSIHVSQDKEVETKKTKRKKGSPWTKWSTEIKNLSAKEPGEARELTDRIQKALPQMDLDTKMALWELLTQETDRVLDRISRVTPKPEQENLPISKSNSWNSGWRAQELTDLWHKYINVGDKEKRGQVLKEIEGFRKTEMSLLSEWKSSRDELKAPMIETAMTLFECSKGVLTKIHSDKLNGTAWPLFWNLTDLIDQDIARLVSKIERKKDAMNQPLTAEINNQ